MTTSTACKHALRLERSEEVIARNMTRRVFSQEMTGGAALLLVHGCGGGGGGGDSCIAAPSGTSCGASGSAISLNHGHALVFSLVDLDSLVAITYSRRGSADHDHTVTLEVAQLRQLKAGGKREGRGVRAVRAHPCRDAGLRA